MPQPPTVNFRLIPERLAVQVGDREVVLTPTQFRLLAVLVKKPGHTFSRAELVEHACEGPVNLRTVDVHVKEVRRKLEPHEHRIQTVRGRGYRYTAG
jgi:DNA-binding response OmpR family regulator